MRVLITGSRGWKNPSTVRSALKLATICVPASEVVVVHGACPNSPDEIAGQVAESLLMEQEPHPADWAAGKHAGFQRNIRMVDAEANVCLAFIRRCAKPECKNTPAHGSHGATHCSRLPTEAGIPTVVFYETD